MRGNKLLGRCVFVAECFTFIAVMLLIVFGLYFLFPQAMVGQ